MIYCTVLLSRCVLTHFPYEILAISKKKKKKKESKYISEILL